MDKLEGYRTQLVAGITATLALAAAFGFNLTDQQEKAVLVFANVVVWPLVMLIMRALTRTPMKNPLTGQRVRASVRTPWLVALFIVLVAWLAGCAGAGAAGPRVAFAAAADTSLWLYEASAQAYVACDRAATTSAQEELCYAQKNARGEAINAAYPHLQAAGQGLITAQEVSASTELGAARALLVPVYAVLAAYLPPEQRVQLGWLDPAYQGETP